MQSGGYGGVSEFQQFIMDGSFALSAPPPQQHQQQQHPGSQGPAPANAAAAAGQQEPFRYQPLLHHALPPHHHHHHHHHAPPMPPHFAHFAGGGGIPFTQQLLHHHHPHLQLFQEQQQHHQKQQQQQQPVAARWGAHHHNPHGHHHQQQHLGFDVEAAVPESSGAASPAPPNVPAFLAAAMNFKLGVDAGGGSGATGGTDVNDGMLHEEAATESRLRRWPGDEEAAIKEPTWRPLDIDYLHSSTSSSKNKEPNKAATPESPPAPAPAANYLMKKDGNAEAAGAAGGNNYKLFSELEAIYKPGSSSGGPAHQTGSGSGLTGDDILAEPALPEQQLAHPHPQVVNMNVNMNNTTNMSETSAGEDVAAMVVEQQHSQQQEELEQEPPSSSGAVMTTKNSNRRKKRRRSQEHQLSASSSFFERLVQRLMEHQESLHRQFLDAMERRERERAARDEAWRRQEADKFAREAAARAQDRASAAAREAAIIAYLEKLSGETITLPEPPPAAATEHDMGGGGGEKDNKEMTMLMSSTGGGSGGHSRWPKHEVEALIRVRTGLEGRFQEPGLKGPLWEVSSRMTAAGYGRSAKRCKEKWENINKYFRKAKESGKKRPSQAKTCPYFQELDRLYSRTSCTSPSPNVNNAEKASSSELLDAVVNKGPPGFSFDSSTDHNAAVVEAIVKGGAEDDVEAKEHEAPEEEARPTTQDQEVEDSHGDDDH